MGVVYFDSHDHYAGVDITEKYNSNNVGTIGSGVGRSVNAYDTQTYLGWVTKTITATANPTVGFAFYIESQLPLTARTLISFRSDSSDHATVVVNPSGLISVKDNTDATVATTTATYALQADTWYYIEFTAAISDTGAYTLDLNGVTALSGTGDFKNGSLTTANIVRISSASQSGNSMYVDDLYIADDGVFLGDIRVEAKFPTSDGNYAQWTCSTGANHYALVDETAPNDDTDYNSSSTATQKDTFGFANSDYASATIHGVQILISAGKDDAGSRSIRPVCRISSTDYFGDTVSVSDDYTYVRYIWLNNPSTGVAWANIAAVNAAEFGYELVS